MYIPSHFSEQDPDILLDLICDYSFGTLITCHEGLPEISHLPFAMDRTEGPEGTLYGHFARANPHWQTLGTDTQAVVVFQGPHSYISPNWYADHSSVPTWNYTAVHATGPVELVEEEEGVLDIVTRLTIVNEAGLPNPWQVNDAGPRLDRMLKAIVGFRIPVRRLEGKFKLSQNKTRADQRGVVEALRDAADPLHRGVAQLMKTRLDGSRG